MLPETAPFPAEQIAALNRIISGSSAEQRTWLSGFLAGLQAANAPQPAAAALPARRAPLTILFATESGNAEALADTARKAAGKLGFAARVLDMADATPAQVASVQNLLATVFITGSVRWCGCSSNDSLRCAPRGWPHGSSATWITRPQPGHGSTPRWARCRRSWESPRRGR
jgi:hypothetical protein